MLNEQTLVGLKKTASRQTLSDTDGEGAERYGGHATDTFNAGVEDGRTLEARDLLDALGVKYTIEDTDEEED